MVEFYKTVVIGLHIGGQVRQFLSPLKQNTVAICYKIPNLQKNAFPQKIIELDDQQKYTLSLVPTKNFQVFL